MRVRWLRKTLANLDAEASYIAEDDPAAARVAVARIMSAVSHLSQQPRLGRPYRVRGNGIEILRVFHVSRRLPQRW